MNEENKDALNNLIHSIQEKMNNNVENSDEASSNISSLLNTLNAVSNIFSCSWNFLGTSFMLSYT